MIAFMILEFGVAALLGPFSIYERANRRSAAASGMTRVLDQEMERLRACRTRACVVGLASTIPPVPPADLDGQSWAHAEVSRTVSPGPEGTLLVVVRATIPGLLLERSLSALLWVDR